MPCCSAGIRGQRDIRHHHNNCCEDDHDCQQQQEENTHHHFHAAFLVRQQKITLKKKLSRFFPSEAPHLPTFVRQVWFAFINLAASRDAAGASCSAAVNS